MSASLYRAAWPLLSRLPPEWAHELGLLALRSPLRVGPRAPEAPFEWRGLRFRNRAGIAAGFDKDARCLRGSRALGAGFVEVGTILERPWSGAPVRPRMKRLVAQRGVWNRLGFPSAGLERIEQRLAAFPRAERAGMLVACNIGPHPLTVRAAGESGALDGVRAELETLARRLDRHADLFVLNLSSPNTPGLRGLLFGPRFAAEIARPLESVLERCARESGRSTTTPLLVKLPPEDAAGEPWSRDALARLVEPLFETDACAGIVAVNTSTRLARAMVPEAAGEYPGGVSGDPLRPLALATLEHLRALLPRGALLAGVGGVMSAQHAREMASAGADVVELYTGMIYRGPALLAECAAALANAQIALRQP